MRNDRYTLRIDAVPTDHVPRGGAGWHDDVPRGPRIPTCGQIKHPALAGWMRVGWINGMTCAGTKSTSGGWRTISNESRPWVQNRGKGIVFTSMELESSENSTTLELT